MAYESGYVCDGCGMKVEPEDAHGWIGVATLEHPKRSDPTAHVNASVCSMDCLLDWAVEYDVPADEHPEMTAATLERSGARTLAEVQLKDLDRAFGQYL